MGKHKKYSEDLRNPVVQSAAPKLKPPFVVIFHENEWIHLQSHKSLGLAQVPIPTICETVGVSRATVFWVQRSGSFTRKLGSGGQFKTQQKLQEQNQVPY